MAKTVTAHETPAGWRVSVTIETGAMRPDEARQLAESLLAAAAEAERIETSHERHQLVRFASV